MANPTRRTFVVSAGAAAAAFGLSKPLALIPSARAKELTSTGYYKFKVGDAEVITVFDGYWDKAHDAGFIRNASIDDTKAALKAAGRSAENVRIPFTITFVKAGGKTVMFDAGTGAQLSPKAGRLAANMKAAGIDPSKIDTIIVTHFHPDHIFGLMEQGTNAQVYPNAQIIVPQAEYAYWTDPGVISSLPKNRQGLAKRIQATFPEWKNLTRFEGEKELIPGFTAVKAHGHTAGHTVVSVASGADEMLVMADTANIPALFVRNPGWHAIFDADPQMAEAARRRIFDRAVTDNLIVTGYHFGMPGAGRIEKDGAGYAFVPLA
ncbi:MAG: MBL fold metallo-hydrolase [Alphaproteobacteria bacterium]|nr:MBL fold metallo-hydrolase [Alphaproteobacteria bacterium]